MTKEAVRDFQGHWGLEVTGVIDERTWELHQLPNCGKGEPNQLMEVGHGIPVMRFRGVATGEEGGN
jgi:hypothetical protein